MWHCIIFICCRITFLDFPPSPNAWNETNKQTKKTPNHLYWSARAAVTNHQKLDGLDNRTWVSQGAGGVGKLGVSGCFQGEERICSGLSPWLVDGYLSLCHFTSSQVHCVRAHLYDLILTPLPLWRPYTQIRSHSEILEVKISVCLFLGVGGDTVQFMTSFLVVGHQKINGGLNLANWLPCWSLAYLLGAEFYLWDFPARLWVRWLI